jgi:hypothetical protein
MVCACQVKVADIALITVSNQQAILINGIVSTGSSDSYHRHAAEQ